MHELGLMAYSETLAGGDIYCDDTGFVEDYLSVLVDDGIGCAEIDCQFLAQERKCHFSVCVYPYKNNHFCY